MAVGSRVIEAGFCYRVTVTEVSAQKRWALQMYVLVSLACIASSDVYIHMCIRTG